MGVEWGNGGGDPCEFIVFVSFFFCEGGVEVVSEGGDVWFKGLSESEDEFMKEIEEDVFIIGEFEYCGVDGRIHGVLFESILIV